MSKIKYTEVSATYIKTYKKYFDLLIVTATEVEKNILHSYLFPINNKNSILKIIKGKQTYFIGKFGKYNAVHMPLNEMGSIGANASLISTSEAINNWNPKIVIAIGIAFGVNRAKQNIGDVLISENITSYEPQRTGKSEIIYRGKESSASSVLLNIFKNLTNWEYTVTIDGKKRKPILKFGKILSGEKLLDNIDERNKLLNEYKTAIGGEMEGAGIIAACDSKVTNWIIIKGICDFADGTKSINKKEFQSIACETAVNLCEYAFDSPHSFNEIPLIPNQVIKSEKKNDKVKNQTSEILNSLITQSKNQILKQKNSGKYLPDTFIEIDENKDHLRYLSDSIFYSKKILEQIINLDFRFFNENQKKDKHKEINIEKDKFLVPNKVNVENSIVTFLTWKNYLQEKLKEIKDNSLHSNLSYKFKHKLESSIKDLDFLCSKIAIITESAGQGKTNFLCDFVDNFLLKRNVPVLFLTGTQLLASNIRQSIINLIFPNTNNYTFDKFINLTENHCKKQNIFLTIVIDGLNENTNTTIFSKNLELFIEDVNKYQHIRIIMSCRTEYYEKNFYNLGKSSFSTDIQQITYLLRRNIEDTIKDKLFNTYIRYFNIKFKFISKKVMIQLKENFLLLRIYCEAFEGQDIGTVYSIYKEDLFNSYYKLKCTEINKRIKDNDEFQISGNMSIKKFLEKVVSFMISNKIYSNIPLDNLVEDSKNKDMYIRFLDENILVKRDLQIEGDEIFTASEVVNFTFDEFRDFLICKYLIKLFYTNEEMFQDFINTEISTNTVLMEGCSTFLFYMAIKSNDNKLKKAIEIQVWYENVFAKCVFELKDSAITEKEKETLKLIWYGNLSTANIIFELVRRYNITYFKNLNINYLFEVIRELEEDEYKKYFSKIFGDRYAHLKFKINQESLISELNEILNREEYKIDNNLHKLFELLLYMFLNDVNWEIFDLYERYSFRNKKISAHQIQAALTSKNENLVSAIKKWKSNYANSI